MLVHVQKKLEEKFPGAKVVVQDTSAGHEAHNSLTNLAVHVVWQGFEGKSLIEQHRMVHDAIAQELKTTIHALRVKTSIQ